MNWKRALLFALKLALAAAIFVALGRKMEQREVEAALGMISLVWILPALLVKAAGIFSSILRWRALLLGQGLRVDLSHLVGSFLVGRFIGLVVPGTVGLDGYRAYDIARHAKAPARSIAVIAVEKVIGFFALGSLVLLTLGWGGRYLPGPALGFIAAGFVLPVSLALGVLAWPGAVEGIARRLLPAALGLREKVGKAAAAAGAYGRNRGALGQATGFGLLVHICTVLMYLFLFRAVGVEVPVTEILFVGPLLIFATAVPLSLSGFGIREGTLAFLLTKVGVGEEQAVLLGLTAFVCSEIFSVLGGFVFMARGRDYAPQIRELRAGVRAENVDDALPPAGSEAASEAAPPEMDTPDSLWALIRASAGGAGIGFSLAGVAEAAHIWRLAGLGTEEGIETLLYAWGVHGLVGALAGLGLGPLIWLAARRVKALGRAPMAAGVAGLLMAGAGGFAFGAFRLIRDLGWGKGAAIGVAALGAGVAAAIAGHLLRVVGERLGRLSYDLSLAVALIAWWIGAAALAPAHGQLVEAEGAATPARPNVILVITDTLRADSVGVYAGADGGASLTPKVDAFAAEASRFERMYSNATWTRPTVATLHTGRLPNDHGVTQKASALPADLPTLATRFKEAGYATAGVVTNVNLAPDFGFGRGFDYYRYNGPTRPLRAQGPAVRLSLVNGARLIQERVSGALVPDRFYAEGPVINAQVEAALEGLGDGPFFLWVHYMDPHDPFMARPWTGEGVARVRTPKPAPEQAEEMKALYRGEVRYWDAAVGTLLDGLKARGLFENSVIALTADHGEEFMDHGGYWHGQTLFDELSRVPLIVRSPGVAPSVDPRLASQLDVAPTLLGRAGLAPSPGMSGTDLLSPEAPPAEARAVILQEDHDGMVLSGVVQGRHKLVVANEGNWRGLPTVALYDLEADPREQRNLAPAQPETVAQLQGRLDGGAPAGAEGGAQPKVEIDQRLEEDLRALGYME